MTPHFTDDHLTVYVGDCRAVMADMPAESVHCVVTSPPYWGLRDYGTATWEGGDAECDHKNENRHQAQGHNSAALGRTIFAEGANRNENFRETCGKCGAHRIDSQLGLEPTPEAYVAAMVDVFREVWRVLRDDGTVWLNLGDSYNAAGRVGHGTRVGYKQGTNRASANGSDHTRPSDDGLKEKDLVGIPWRVAFALQADGWYLRSDIIWAKPNPMPESVIDRPTKSHEYVFLLSKSARYYFDADAVRGQHAELDRPQSEKRRLQRMGREVAVVAGGGQSSKGIDDGWVTPTHTMRTNEAGRRRAILIDLSADYIDQAMLRNAQAPLGLGA